jgi:hypothetical protein
MEYEMIISTIEDLRAAQDENPKYDFVGRAGYYAEAARYVDQARHRRILECGPFMVPLVKGADTLDVRDDISATWVHDATVLPWPVEDRAYDLVVALQFLEHMEGRQAEVFEEMRRVGLDVLLSLPYKWPADEGDHGCIDMAKIIAWTREPTLFGIDTDRLGYDRIVLYYRRESWD